MNDTMDFRAVSNLVAHDGVFLQSSSSLGYYK